MPETFLLVAKTSRAYVRAKGIATHPLRHNDTLSQFPSHGRSSSGAASVHRCHELDDQCRKCFHAFVHAEIMRIFWHFMRLKSTHTQLSLGLFD